MTVSSSRLTLLPLVFVGSSERATLPPETEGASPELREFFSADSKSVRPARKPGVLMLAMLSAVTRERSASPLSAACKAVVVTSPTPITGCTAVRARRTPGRECRRTRSTSGYAGEHSSDECCGPPIRGEALLSVLLSHRHPEAPG